mmetsp:Transcript_877/g.2011  ORF Transcript_877/g.2011 Transcript_877/m.2011 type:complete len:201 (+) Transcript_877:910-1512(+)
MASTEEQPAVDQGNQEILNVGGEHQTLIAPDAPPIASDQSPLCLKTVPLFPRLPKDLGGTFISRAAFVLLSVGRVGVAGEDPGGGPCRFGVEVISCMHDAGGQLLGRGAGPPIAGQLVQHLISLLVDEEHHKIRRIVVRRTAEPQLIKVAEKSPPRALEHDFAFTQKNDIVNEVVDLRAWLVNGQDHWHARTRQLIQRLH